MAGVSRRLDPVWRHSPLLLLRHPALFAAVAFGTMLLTAAVAAYPLFLSAASSDLVRGAIERPHITRYGAGLTYSFSNLPLDPIRLEPGIRSPDQADLHAAFGDLAAESPLLGEPVASALGDTVTVSLDGSEETREGRLFASTGVLDHVTTLEGHDGDGVWLPDLIAEALGAGPGDTIELQARDGGVASVEVDGVYLAPYRGSFTGYWYRWRPTFIIACPDCSPPPQPILADRDQVVALARELGHDSVSLSWQAPIRDPGTLSLERAQEFQRYEQRVLARTSDGDTTLGRLFICCRSWFFLGRETTLTSSIRDVVNEAKERIGAVEGPTRVLEIAGVAVALVVVAAAGAFSVRARRVEASWLFAHGSSAGSVAVKTALESALPAAAGGLLGLGAAFLAVGLLGPDGAVDPTAAAGALLGTLAAAAGAAALISVAAGWTFVRTVDPHGRRFARLASVVPWELAIGALAYLAFRRLREGGAFVPDETLGVAKPSLALVAFPFLFFAAAATFSARLAKYAFTALRRPTRSASPVPYLATRRLAGGASFTVLLVAASGLCFGTFLHAQFVSRSLESAVDAKAAIYIGSDVQGAVDYRTPPPETFPYPLTRVVRFPAGVRLPTGRPLDLLAVDARTLAGAAYWNDAFADVTLDELADRLRSPSGDGVPAVLAGAGGLQVHELLIATGTVRVDVVGRASAFPGMSSLNPLVVVDEETLLALGELPFNPLPDARASTELWVRGEPGEVREAFAAVKFPPYTIYETSEVKDIPYVAAAIDTFVVLNALGLIAAALTFVGILMYLQARQRSQVVSYALSVRMGMRHAQQRRALVLELGAMLAWAFAVGTVLAVVAARVTVPLLDPITTIPPDPVVLTPWSLVAVTAILLGGLAWAGAAVTNRRAGAVDLGEVMRVAE